ncbi:MAG TPA: acetate/propionate family kinase [Roseiflexaceae bacterium]|nr:acetate/propionate family kinase [Roseiflexaceae bacterium]
MSEATHHILTVNAGSGSLHVDLFPWDGDEPAASHDVDWQGAEHDTKAYTDAVGQALEQFDRTWITAVGHRVVHGGTKYQRGVRIDDEVKRTIRAFAPLAPQHNPVALSVIEAMERALPGVMQAAAFDTAFHHTLPPHAYLYGVPYAWYEDWGVRRFGFHGLSHAYCAERAAALLGRPLAQTKIVTCHLGSGCSLAAVDGGRSIATTMGYTPLDGVVMGSRSGAVDPGLLLHLLEQGKLDVAALRDALGRESGLKGLSGVSADMRDVSAARQAGHKRAALAVAVYTARIREAIGAMAAALGGLDAITFADGVGEHCPEVRAAIIAPLGWMGIVLDDAANRSAQPDQDVATPEARVRVFVIHTREALMVAREVRRVLRL